MYFLVSFPLENCNIRTKVSVRSTVRPWQSYFRLISLLVITCINAVPPTENDFIMNHGDLLIFLEKPRGSHTWGATPATAPRPNSCLTVGRQRNASSSSWIPPTFHPIHNPKPSQPLHSRQSWRVWGGNTAAETLRRASRPSGPVPLPTPRLPSGPPPPHCLSFPSHPARLKLPQPMGDPGRPPAPPSPLGAGWSPPPPSPHTHQLHASPGSIYWDNPAPPPPPSCPAPAPQGIMGFAVPPPPRMK